jgi:hypothetical protein
MQKNSLLVFADENIDIGTEKNGFLRIRFGFPPHAHPNHYSLLRSVAAFFPENHLRVQNVLHVKAASVERLTDLATEPQQRHAWSLRLIACFGRQLAYLQRNEKKSFYTLDPAKFVVFDRRVVCYFSVDHLKEMRDKDQKLHIFSVPDRTPFLCPVSFEAFLCKNIYPPMVVSPLCVLYSFGNVVLFLFWDASSSSTSFQKTKLGAFLLRCIDSDLRQRSFLFL